MNAPPPPQKTREDPTAVPATLAPQISAGAMWILTIIPVIILFVFHLGAAFLSYKKFGSMMWAVVDFIFAYFYYPYYAFFLDSTPVESAPMTPIAMVGGMAKALMGARRRK
jgi:uncharacterized RDD family membrane protein YckC